MSGDVKVHAVRFASAVSTKAANYLRYDIYREPDGPQIIDCYFWVVQTAEHVVIVDGGFERELAERWGIAYDLDVHEGLAALGIEPADVDIVVLSHLHSDHSGNLDLFERAEIILQRDEYAFWFGPMAERSQFRGSVEAAHLASVAAADATGRLRLVDGDVRLSEEIALIFAPGHTPGTQLVEVAAGDVKIVLAVDALHFFEELELDRPFLICSDVPAMYRSFDLMRALSADGVRLVPGHDRAVAEQYASTPLGAGVGLLIDLTAPIGAVTLKGPDELP